MGGRGSGSGTGSVSGKLKRQAAAAAAAAAEAAEAAEGLASNDSADERRPKAARIRDDNNESSIPGEGVAEADSTPRLTAACLAVHTYMDP